MAVDVVTAHRPVRPVDAFQAGLRDGVAGRAGRGRSATAEYDPRTRTLAQPEEAKAAELSAAGLPASVVTVRRMRARYRREVVWGLVDHRGHPAVEHAGACG